MDSTMLLDLKTRRLVTTVSLLIMMSIAHTDARLNVVPRDTVDTTNDVIPPRVLLNATYNEWQQRLIESIKREILNKLGMSNIPDVRNVNTSVEERREILRKYERSLEECHGHTLPLFYDQLHYADTFDIFTDNGKFLNCKYYDF